MENINILGFLDIPSSSGEVVKLSSKVQRVNERYQILLRGSSTFPPCFGYHVCWLGQERIGAGEMISGVYHWSLQELVFKWRPWELPSNQDCLHCRKEKRVD